MSMIEKHMNTRGLLLELRYTRPSTLTKNFTDTNQKITAFRTLPRSTASHPFEGQKMKTIISSPRIELGTFR